SIGAPRFELGTPCAQGRCATRLRYAPSEAPKRQQSVRAAPLECQTAASKEAFPLTPSGLPAIGKATVSSAEALSKCAGRSPAHAHSYQLNATLPSARRPSRSPPKLSQCSSSSALLTFKPSEMWSVTWKLAPTST